MSATRKRNLIQVNLDKVAAHSPYGRKFVDKYSQSQQLADRQALLFNAIASGYILEESGLSGAFRAMDSEEFSRSDRDGKMQILEKAMSLFSSIQSISSKGATEPTSRPVTLADLEKALLDDSGPFAAADEAKRADLIMKVASKYGLQVNPAPTEKAQETAGETSAGQTTVNEEDGSQNSTMAMPKTRSRIATFNQQ